MFLQSLKRPLPRVIAFIFLIAIAIWFRGFLFSYEGIILFDFYEMPFYGLVKYIFTGNDLVEKIVTFILVLFIALFLLQINTRHIIIKQRTYLPALIYILVCSSFVPLQSINPAVFAAFFIVLALDRLYTVNKSQKPLSNLFLSSFLISIATLFYFPSIVGLLLIFFSLVILNQSSLRSWLIVLFGYVAPLFFLTFYFYYFESQNFILVDVLEKGIAPMPHRMFYDGIIYKMLYGFSGLMLIVGTLFLLGSLTTQKIDVRKYQSILLGFLIFFGSFALIVPFASAEIIYLIAIPFAFILANYFTLSRNRFWPEFFLSLMFVFTILMQIF
jgi:hypothetical protein